MECPYCSRSFAATNKGRCPHCGRPLETSVIGVVRTSQVRVAAGDDDRIYASLEDVPPDLRRQIRRALSGPLADTIVIADEGGRRRIFEAIRGLPPDLQKKVLSAVHLSETPKPRLSRRARLLIAGGVAAAAVLALVLMWM